MRSLRTTFDLLYGMLKANRRKPNCKEVNSMNRRKWIALCLAGCLLLALSACGNPGADAENSGGTEAPTQTEEPAQAEEPTQQETLVEYAVEGLGTFTLPEGFTQEAGEIAEPLPTTYATFEKDGYYIQANRFGTDAYEMAGVPLPTDLEDYSTRSGVQDSVPEGTVFDYDDYGNFAAQFIQEDGQLCYYVLLQGEESFGSIYLTAPKDQFDADTVAQWLSGSVLE